MTVNKRKEMRVSFNESPFQTIVNEALNYNKNTVKIIHRSTLQSVGLRSSAKILGKFYGKSIQIVCDTGSTISAISEKLGKNLKIIKNNEKIYGANGRILSLLGEADVTICLNNVEFEIRVKIIRNLSPDMVLGINFAEKYNADLDFKEGKLCLMNGKSLVSVPMKWHTEMKNTSIFSAVTSDAHRRRLNCAALHFFGHVNNARLPILTDSGSCTNLIDKHYVRKSDIISTKTIDFLKTANNENINIIGMTEVQININGIMIRENAYVVDSLSVPIILGNFFLEKYEAKINLSTAKILLKHPDIDFPIISDIFWQGQKRRLAELSEDTDQNKIFQMLSNIYETCKEPKSNIFEVTVANGITLNPFESKKLVLKINKRFPAKYGYLSFNREYKKSKHLVFQHGVYHANKYLKITVSNKSDTPYFLNKFQKIGTFEKVETLPIQRVNQINLENEKLREGIENFIIDKNRTEEEKRRGNDLLNEYKDIFQFSKKGFKAGQAVHEPIVLKKVSDDIPSRPQYPSGKIQRELIDQYVQELKDAGAVVPSDSCYNSPLVLVKKKSEGYRVVCDYRQVNKVLQGYSYPIPRIQDILSSLNGTSMYSIVDLYSGFFQLKLAEGFSQDITSFSTNKEHLKFTCLGQGLSPSPSHFQAFVNKTFASLLFTDILVYLDDILVFSNSFDQMIIRLRKFFDICREKSIKLNAKKCKFFLDECELLGFTVNKHGIKPSESMTEKVKSFKSPTSSKLLRSFLGFAGYFRHHIKNFAKISAPLREILREDPRKFKWNNEAEQAFQILKQKLLSRPILRHFNQDLPIEIHVDASKRGLGACMMQPCPETKKNYAVAYASRTLTKTEQHYSVSERELLAVVFACQRWRNFVFGVPFTVVSDHTALKSASTIDSKTGRLSRLAMKLMEFNITWKYTAGRKHLVPDCLSRYFTLEELIERDMQEVEKRSKKATIFIVGENLNLENLGKQQRQDDELKTIFRALETPDDCTSLQRRRAKQFEIIDSILYKKEGKTNRTVIPASLQDSILEQTHSDEHSGGHCGISKSLDKLNRSFYWKGMSRDMKEFVKTCSKCLFSKKRSGPEVGKIHSHEIPNQPMEKICIDIQGPNALSDGYRYIILASCYLTSYVYLKPIKAADSRYVIEFLREFIAIFGCPKVIQSDRGSHFTSDEVENFMKQMGIKHNLSASYAPWQNSKAERNFSFIGNF